MRRPLCPPPQHAVELLVDARVGFLGCNCWLGVRYCTRYRQCKGAAARAEKRDRSHSRGPRPSADCFVYANRRAGEATESEVIQSIPIISIVAAAVQSGMRKGPTDACAYRTPAIRAKGGRCCTSSLLHNACGVQSYSADFNVVGMPRYLLQP
jgi:hypothetical protein